MVAECCTVCSRLLCDPYSQQGLAVHLSLTYEPASRSKGGGQEGQLYQSSVTLDNRSNTRHLAKRVTRIVTALPLTPPVACPKAFPKQSKDPASDRNHLRGRQLGCNGLPRPSILLCIITSHHYIQTYFHPRTNETHPNFTQKRK